MIFKRREKQPLLSALCNMIWPKMGWKRAISYYKLRVIRLPHSTHDIAMGIASGCAVSWTPTFPFHILQSYIFCKLVRASFPAALLGTIFGNPWTFPLLFMISYNVGNLLLTLLGFDMSLKIETDKNQFNQTFEMVHVLLITSLQNTGNFLLELVGVKNFFINQFSASLISNSHEFFNKILIPTLVGGYMMAILSFPLFYYSFYYLVTAWRASRKAVSNKVHNIIEHRHERRHEKRERRDEKRERRKKERWP